MKESVECMVVAIDQGMAKVRVKMHSDCSSCGLCEGSDAVYYEAINQVDAKCGKSVILEIEKQGVLKIAFIVFVLPLLVIAASSEIGICFANFMHLSGLLVAIILSGMTLVPTFIFIKKYDEKVQSKSSLPIITKIINE